MRPSSAAKIVQLRQTNLRLTNLQSMNFQNNLHPYTSTN